MVSEGRGRVFGGLAALAVLWIIVYWWWEPREPSITFDPSPPSAEGDGLAAAWQGGDVQPLPGSGAGRPAEPPRPPRVVEPRPAVIPPRFREYTVRDGDTWESIAQRELGSAAHAEAILRSNPLMSGDRPKAGRAVRLPLDPGNIQGRPVQEVAAAAPPAGEGVVEYTIKSGDTLSGIAKAHYGSVTYADYIYTANRDRLRSPDELRLGDKLRLPPKPR